MTSIHQVILDGRLSQLNFLVKRFYANVNEKDSFQRTPLHLAALCDQENFGYRVARLLLEADADVNLTDGQRQTPFIYACLLNRSKLITLFIQTKMVDWHMTDHDSFLPIHHAAASCQTSALTEIVQEMKSIGLSVDLKTDLGYTPLILAIKYSRFDNALYLLDKTDASPFAIDDEFRYTCQQWARSVGPKANDWTSYNRTRRSQTMIKPNRNQDKNIPNYKCFYGVESPYQCRMLICNHHHTKSFAESKFTPAIFSPRLKDSKSSTSLFDHDKQTEKSTYQLWIELVQRLHERTISLKSFTESSTNIQTSLEKSFTEFSQPPSPYKGLQRSQTWVAQESASPWVIDKLNSNKQVTQLINHYSNLLSADSKQVLTQQFTDRPKSILRPIGSPNKYRFNKEVTFAAT